MQFASRKPNPEVAILCPERSVSVDLKFTQTGKFLIAAGSDRPEGQGHFSPVLYISLVGEKGWAMHYPLDGKFQRDEDAAAAALHYGIQIINRQVRDVRRPGDPVPIVAA